MRNQIERAMMLSVLIAAIAGAGACQSPPGEVCGDARCSEGYHCALIDDTPRCIDTACGDGVAEGDEECDDGNLADNDNCLQSCRLNACGDGHLNILTEECDDGNGVNGDGCDNNCTVTACGNGQVTAGEMCDDGNNNDNDDCNNSCIVRPLVYLKASNTGAYDIFGWSVALSADGSTLAVGASGEDSAATGVGGHQTNDFAADAGAVYVFTRSGTTWVQQAYLKASNTGASDRFGFSVALSADGSTLAVGAPAEASAATGIGGDQADNAASGAGAVYVFTRTGTTWSQQAYVKASNTGAGDFFRAGDSFGDSIALSADGSTLAVGAPGEASAATGIDGDQANNSAASAGAVYVFTRNGTTWSQQAYLKASNTDAGDCFGSSVALSANGSTLAVGAPGEASAATGIDGNQADNSAASAGAVYVFTRSGMTWSQQAYIKESSAGTSQFGIGDQFGSGVTLSSDGSTLAVGAIHEANAATGIDGNRTDYPAFWAGAVFVFTHIGTTWSQQAYVKASNTGEGDQFGSSVALSADGSTLAVGATWEDSAATGINGYQADNSARDAGAVYVFTRSGTTWSQHAYLKASNTDAGDYFGSGVALSADGTSLVVGAFGEDSRALGMDGDQADNSAMDAGAVYVFRSGAWLP